MNKNHSIAVAALVAATVALTGCTSTGTDPVSAARVGETIPGVDGAPFPAPVIVTDRVTIGGECVRVLRVDGRLYTLPDRDGDGALQLAPDEASKAVTGCRIDPSR